METKADVVIRGRVQKLVRYVVEDIGFVSWRASEPSTASLPGTWMTTVTFEDERGPIEVQLLVGKDACMSTVVEHKDGWSFTHPLREAHAIEHAAADVAAALIRRG